MIKKILTIIFFLFLLIPNTSFSINISVVDIETIINNHPSYLEFLNKIDEDQIKYLDNFNKIEQYLEGLKIEIEDTELILNENEINKLINNYNVELNNYTNQIENFNEHYQNELIRVRKIIFEEIIVLIEKYAKNNKIDLVLESNSYLMATNSINITNELQNEFNNINIILEINNFEQN